MKMRIGKYVVQIAVVILSNSLLPLAYALVL